jgi:hypothetical protein
MGPFCLGIYQSLDRRKAGRGPHERKVAVGEKCTDSNARTVSWTIKPACRRLGSVGTSATTKVAGKLQDTRLPMPGSLLATPLYAGTVPKRCGFGGYGWSGRSPLNCRRAARSMTTGFGRAKSPRAPGLLERLFRRQFPSAGQCSRWIDRIRAVEPLQFGRRCV